MIVSNFVLFVWIVSFLGVLTLYNFYKFLTNFLSFIHLLGDKNRMELVRVVDPMVADTVFPRQEQTKLNSLIPRAAIRTAVFGVVCLLCLILTFLVPELYQMS